jgi:hypothetical protein
MLTLKNLEEKDDTSKQQRYGNDNDELFDPKDK